MEMIIYLFIYLYLFLRDRERQSLSGGGAGREGDAESEAGSRLRAVSTEPRMGLKLTKREIMTWAEVGRLTDWATQAPWSFDFLSRSWYTGMHSIILYVFSKSENFDIKLIIFKVYF